MQADICLLGKKTQFDLAGETLFVHQFERMVVRVLVSVVPHQLVDQVVCVQMGGCVLIRDGGQNCGCCCYHTVK